MKLTEWLNVEHGVFLVQIKLLEELVQQKAPIAVCAAVVETLARALEAHDQIEDRLLYPELGQVLGNPPALAAMKREHEEIERLVRDIRNDPSRQWQFERFAVLLTEHIEREIHFLFPMAEEYLSEERLTSMGNWYAMHASERTGRQGLHTRGSAPKPRPFGDQQAS